MSRVLRRDGLPARARSADPFAAWRTAFERNFENALATRCAAPGTLGRAIRYAALSPGKRLRPLLTLASCEGVGGDWKRALPAAAAIECVHAFSLVHDDLPAMDDDDYRRGRLTTHKKHGEALGILAGDALLALAFEELAKLRARGIPPSRVLGAIEHLARASGALELVGGQALDIEYEGKRVTTSRVAAIDVHKTGALMGAALAIGSLTGGAAPGRTRKADGIGKFLGFAFQMQDDLLNAGSSLRRLGKRAGTDHARGKATMLRLHGRAETGARIGLMFDLIREDVRREFKRPRALLAVIEAMAARGR